MKRRLQSFGFRGSAYERPNQSWICGKAALGQACKLGPDGKGRCHTLQECEPRNQAGAWVCGRTAGGPCDAGPLPDGRCSCRIPPCVPVRSLRSRRGRVAGLVASLSLALLLLAFGGTFSRDLIYPGPVNMGHSQVGDCSNCHVAFEGGPAVWLHAAFVAGNPADDSSKCLACHNRGKNALTPHNLPPAELAEITAKTRRVRDNGDQPWDFAVTDALFSLPEEASGTLACAACHKEHEGEFAPLTQVSNARCQSCHSGRFGSFAESHPQFGTYPYMRRTRLVFDHDGHNRKHFPETKDVKPPETCADCHLPGPAGRFMLVRSFDETCAACHNDDINGDSLTGPKGIAFIAIPGLDLETLAARGRDVGDWPTSALAEEIPPFAKLLLASDATIAADLERVRDLDFQDLRTADAAQLDAVMHIAWAIKELLFDLTVSGVEGFQSRVEASLNQSIKPEALGPLLGHLPQDVVRSAARAWFPRLNRDVTEYRAKKSALLLDGDWRVGEAIMLEDGGYLWRRAMAVLLGQSGSDTLSDDELLAIDDNAINPDDELLFLDEAGNRLASPPGPVIGESGGGGAPTPTPATAETEQETQPDEAQETASQAGEQKQEEESAEAEPAAAEAKAAANAEAEANAEEASEPAEAAAAPGQVIERTEAAVASTKAPPAAPALPEPEPEDVAARSGQSLASAPAPEAEGDIEVATLDPEAWAKTGGWYRRDDVLYYRPVTHKDPFLRAWFDIATMPDSRSAARHSNELMAVLEHKDTPGKCSKCHSIERTSSGALTVNWQPFSPHANETTFTMFVHATHFSVLGDDAGCTTCHQLDRDAKYLDAYKDRDPAVPVSNFAPLKREVCAECHSEQGAGETCTLCHSYHIGDFMAKPMPTRMAELSPEAAFNVARDRQRADVPTSPWLDLADRIRVLVAAGETTGNEAEPGPASQQPPATDDRLAMILRSELTLPEGNARSTTAIKFETPWKSAPIEQSLLSDVRAIHLSSHRTMDEATAERSRLKELFKDLLADTELSIQEVDLGDRGVFYRVRSGPYHDRQMAEAYCAELKRRRQDCLVTPY